MTDSSIKKNIFLNIIYTCTNILFPLVTFPYAARILLTENMGKVSFFSAVSNYIIMLGALGISTYGVRAIAKVRVNKEKISRVVIELLTINVFVTSCVLGLFIISCFFISSFQKEPMLCLINGCVILTAPFNLNWLYQGLEQYEYITKRTILFKCLAIVLMFTLIKDQSDYIVYALIMAASTLGTCCCNFIYARKFVVWKKYQEISLRVHLKPLLVLFASLLAVSVYTNLDTVMLGFISGNREVGLYTVAVKVKTLLLAIVTAVSAVLFPRLSAYLAEGKLNEYNDILKKSIMFVFMISIPLSSYFVFQAYDAVLLLGGQDYIDAVLCMRVVMPVLIVSGFSNIIGNQILIPRGLDTCFMKAVVAGALVNIILNVMLMPHFGCVGAAIATLSAEVLQMSIQVFYSKETLKNNFQVQVVLKYLLLSTVAIVFMTFMNSLLAFNGVMNLVVTAILFFCSYAVLLLSVKDELAVSLFDTFRKDALSIVCKKYK